MCGISGYYSTDHFFTENDLDAMVSVQVHRGPDSNGKYLHGNVGLGHNRLSIIDLSERANQPMFTNDGRYALVYNGEIYNYNEIGSQIKYDTGGSVAFHSSSDSEVLLNAFAQYGINAVEHFNGMFAFAIYDKLNEELYLVRDRLGIKPLYYYWDGKNFAFSSELKTLRAIKNIKFEVNYEQIPVYLHLGYIPAPNSIYKNCFKLAQGHYLKVSKAGIQINKYWELPNGNRDQIISNEKKAIVVISDLLASSIQYQLNSDVPFGVFLSGGIDSSLVAASASKLSGTKINTFSIGFEREEWSEAVYAKRVADYLNTNHHEYTVKANDAIAAIENYMDAFSEPFGDSSGIPTLLVSLCASKHVKVVLTGEGGDELFHGYGAYKWAQRLNNPMIYAFRKLIAKTLLMSGNERNKRVSSMFNIERPENIRSHIFSNEQYLFSSANLKSIFSPNVSQLQNGIKYIDDVNDKFNQQIINDLAWKGADPRELQALFDLKYYLADDLLVKVDRASMFHSIESRVPYLDHRLVEAAVKIDVNLKNNPSPKYILKEILYQYVPESFFQRPKRGFSIPLAEWLKNEMYFLINDYLNKEIVERFDLFQYEEIALLIKRFKAGENYLANKIWLLIVLHRWLIKYAV